jgi:hypothetical protein
MDQPADHDSMIWLLLLILLLAGPLAYFLGTDTSASRRR